MADFCRQCSLRLFGEDFRDLAWEDWVSSDIVANLAQDDIWIIPSICEGCGFVEVARDGTCTGGDKCMENHPTLEES